MNENDHQSVSLYGTVLCSISEFFHNSKIHNSSKNLVLFVYILKGNSYFYSLQQYSAVCLLRNHNLFTFSMYFYPFYSQKSRQIASICIKISIINYICPKKTIENGYFQKKISLPLVGSEPMTPEETQI